VLGWCLWLHLRNRLDLTLQSGMRGSAPNRYLALGPWSYLKDQEPLVIEIDPFALQQRGHLGKRTRPLVDGVLGRVVAIRRSCDDDLGVWDGLVLVPGLQEA
jgi:hypothetical protein